MCPAALLRAHRLNKNPRDGEASMLLGSALERQGDEAGAWDHYYKASWSGNCRDAAWWALARLAMKRGDTADALEKVNTSLQFNASNHLAMGLKALALANSGRTKEAQAYIVVCLEQYPLSYPLHCARWMIAPGDEARASLLRVTGRRGINGSLLAGWLLSIGQKQAAKEVLEVLDCQEALPMLWRASLSDDANKRQRLIAEAERCHARKVRFPNTLDEVQMLQTLSDSAFARYLLGCFWYSKRRYEEAVSCWRETLEKSPDYAPAHRLLGVYAWNKQQDAAQALAYLQRAVELEPENARFLFELDFLKKSLGTPVNERLETLAARKAVVLKRDDLTAELLSLWNAAGHYADAAAILGTRVFHPWEGGEGKSPASICSISSIALYS
jgi:tetratricopeptide (TPR) repeat protein